MRLPQWICISCFLILFALCLPLGAQNQSTANAPSEGTRIGTIIKDAINVALPNSAKLIESIFGTSNKTDKQTATNAINKAADTSKAASNQKLAETAGIATELGVINQYLELSLPASQRVARLLARLEDATGSALPSNTKNDWQTIDDDLKKLADIKESDINKVQPGLRLRLIEIRNIYDSNRDDIAASITNKDLASLKAQLRAISSLLNSIVPMAGIEIADLQAGFTQLAQQSSHVTAQGVDTSSTTTTFTTLADDDIAAAKRTLHTSPAAR